MKQCLIIPMGGKGQRFINAGYKIYKPFLKISENFRIIDKIVKNFNDKNIEIIIIGNLKRIQSAKLSFKNKVHLINIEDHKLGPLYSIFLANQKLKKIIKDHSFFISYSDINWNWNFSRVNEFISKKETVVFTHFGFHPHLEVDDRSDFCLADQNENLIEISQKKPISKDYKNDLLAIGCYYFKKYSLIGNFFQNYKNFLSVNKKEYYLVTLLKYLIRKENKINFYNIDNFVHLGLPSQYEDFINWKKILIDKFKISLKLNQANVMLMAGKGKRVKKLNQKKPFLKIENFEMYDYIFKKYGTNRNFIITTKSYYRDIKKKYNIFKINQSNSMLQTIEKSAKLFKNKKNFFLSSCDCFGIFDKRQFNKFIKQKNPDIILFAYKFSSLQNKLRNSHTILNIKNNKLISIKVKKNTKNSIYGHAGFFWIKNSNVFNFISGFKKTCKQKRELLVDDYFKYLFDNNKFKVKYFKLENYLHIGSFVEYNELNYWINYFKNENRKIY
jgi:hypothetical protein|tara:strand:+ start:96 stop:1595 length:1500 start_codon:yes stop_codon:yes gene_type:complete